MAAPNRPRLSVIPGRGHLHSTALPRGEHPELQTGRPGVPKRTKRLREAFQLAATASTTCGHDNASITVLHGGQRMTACAECVLAISRQQVCHIEPLPDPDPGSAA